MGLHQPEDLKVFNLFSLKGKVSLVTGSTKGIGLAVAIGLAEAGSDIAIVYRSTPAEEAEKISNDLAAANGVRVKSYQADVTNRERISNVVQQVVRDFGKLDVVVINSGISVPEPAEEVTEKVYHDIFGVNVDGAFFTAQAAGKVFKSLVADGVIKQGKIIFTASVSAVVVNIPQKQSIYNASKAAVVRLAKCLAVEWVDFARVNCVSPGYVNTEMVASFPKDWLAKWLSINPAQRNCSPYELKGSYVFLASDASSYITGENLVTDGGVSILNLMSIYKVILTIT